MSSRMSEWRGAFRGLFAAPVVTIAAIVCLALGIGATTAVSTAVNRALVQPLPLERPERLVAIHRTTPASGPHGTWPHSPANYFDLSRMARSVEGVAALASGSTLIELPGASMQVTRLSVTGNLFGTLGARAFAGRLIQSEDDRLEASEVAVLSHDFWRTRFGGDSGVVGRVVSVDGKPHIVVGILPADFRIPHGSNVLRADVWLPMRFTPDRRAQRQSNFLQVLGRLRDGATVDGAGNEMRQIFAGLAETHSFLRGENVRVDRLHAENVQTVRKPLLLIFGAVCMVLLIATTNVAALLLARGVQRRREMAVRAALGASSWALARPVLLESAIIAAAGAAGGILLAIAGTRTIGALAAERMQQLAGLSLDGVTLTFALSLSVIVALACGAVPAWRSASADPQSALAGGRGGGTGRDAHRALMSLIVLEISLSMTLMVGAGLTMKAFTSLLARDPGFETGHVLVARVTSSAARYPNQTGARDLIDPVVRAVQEIPGVEAVGGINLLPYVNWGVNSNIRYEGQPGSNIARLPIVEQRTVTPGYFAVTGQRLLAGRLLTPADDERPSTARVVVANAALAKRDFRGRLLVGRRFHTSDTTFATIVGIVSNVRNVGPVADPAPEVYWTYWQSSPGAASFSLMIRTRGDNPIAVLAGVRDAVRSVDPGAAVSNVMTMSDAITSSLGRPRFYFSLLGGFALIALLLAMAGLYGVMTYAVVQRTREIGIRSALGGTRGVLMRLVTGTAIRLVLVGIAVGLAGGFAVTRLMVSMLYGVSPLDPWAWIAAPALIVAAGIVASLLPAYRAARVDPSIAMRAE